MASANILTKPVAGTYLALYGASGSEVTVGETLEGMTMTIERNAEEIFVDHYGRLPIDQINQNGRVTLRFVLAEFGIAAALSLFEQYGAVIGTPGIAGVFGTDAVGTNQLKFTALTGTSAADTSVITAYQTIVAKKAVVSPVARQDIVFATKLRVLPIEVTCYPWSDSGTIRCVKFS